MATTLAESSLRKSVLAVDATNGYTSVNGKLRTETPTCLGLILRHRPVNLLQGERGENICLGIGIPTIPGAEPP